MRLLSEIKNNEEHESTKTNHLATGSEDEDQKALDNTYGTAPRAAGVRTDTGGH